MCGHHINEFLIAGVAIAALIGTSFSFVHGTATCPSAWFSHGESCYWPSDFTVPWSSAAAACSYVSANSHPVSVHSGSEQDALFAALNGRTAWIGLHRQPNLTNFSWLDGSPVDFTFWDHGQPAADRCALTNASAEMGRWATADCRQDHHFVCQQPADQCPHGWTRFNNSCYILSQDLAKGDFDTQFATCRSLHPDATPVVVHGEEVNQVLHSLLKYDNAWMGLAREGYSKKFRWIDGTYCDDFYTKWTPTAYCDSVSIDTNVYMNMYGEWDCGYYPTGKRVFCQLI